jgi:hypothetical protein
MKRKAHLFGAVAAALLVAAVAAAQQSVILRDGDGSTTWIDVYGDGTARGTTPKGLLIMGDDGTNIQAISTTSGGLVNTAQAPATHAACTNTAQTVTGTASNIPTTAMATRRSLTICASTALETISCEFDGSAAVLATGIELGDQDCVVVSLVNTVNASCISDGTSVDVRIPECP